MDSASATGTAAVFSVTSVSDGAPYETIRQNRNRQRDHGATPSHAEGRRTQPKVSPRGVKDNASTSRSSMRAQTRQKDRLGHRRPDWRLHNALYLPRVPALLFWWRLPEFPLEHRRRRGLRVYLSPAFRGNRNVTVGREALICFALFSFLSMPCIIMIGHGAHRRQGGSQLAAEPACSRRVRTPAETWGDGCSRQVGEATTRRES